jgi:hypothetical protein
VRDPLVHFVVFGALLFGAWALFNPQDEAADPRTIVVDRAALLTFIQYRTRSFDAEAAAHKLDNWPPEVVRDLVNDFIREEALHRSARAMGLDADDYVIRQRLVQKVEYMAEGIAGEITPPDEEVLAAWYVGRVKEYVQPETVTFTHVFVAADRHGADAARLEVDRLLQVLNRDAVPFEKATAFGDRYAYHVNYVEKGREEIVSHFGEAMAAAVFALKPDTRVWQGPLESALGFHAVLITRHAQARTPALEEVRSQVLNDWRAEAMRERRDAFVDRVIADFSIVRAPEFEVPAEP